MKVKNPILRGFIQIRQLCGLEMIIILANSTFEWWPGVSLHHSRDAWNLP